MTLLLLFACVTDDVKPGGADSNTNTTIDDTGPTNPTDDTGSPDDSDPATDSDPVTTGDNDSILVGDWLSEGSNIAPLLANFYISVLGSFENGGAYSVTATRENGNVDELSGTFTVDLSTTPHTIALVQVLPYDAVAEGIWQVSGSTLTYEIVQTEPNPYGYVAPTPSGGFGSSSGGTLQPGDNVQIFVRQ